MPDDISEWLLKLGLVEYASNFSNNNIDASLLTQLSNEDLKEMDVNSLGHRKVILSAIALLNAENISIPPKTFQKSEAEHRQLTVMFCDLVGSTAMSQRLDPEDLRRLITSYQSACNTVVAHFDGYVARYLGDGLLIYFGYPAAHEDDAERAVRAGLGIVKEVALLKFPLDVELSVRVGIATGMVIAGDLIGEGASEERAVLGETPNLAARLHSIAPPGGVVIADSTMRLVEGRIDASPLEPVILKGFSVPVRAYRATAVQTTSRFEAATVSGLSDFIGRNIELKLLEDRWKQVCSGEGQVVLLSGEAGIGKSRILRELREQLDSKYYTRVSYQCSPYGANTAFLPIIDQLRSTLGFTNNDSGNDKFNKLKNQTREVSVINAAPLLAAMMSLSVDAYPNIALSPARQKLDTLAVLVEHLELLARSKPVVIFIEDVHWIDPTTLEVFDAFVECIQKRQVLMVVTCRPEFGSRWGEYGHITQLSLNRLSRVEGRVLAERVTGGRKLPDNVLTQILESTDGVPLFVEELVKTVLESGVVREVEGRLESESMLATLAIPNTLKDSLMARLDRLSPVKEVAQAAACIGREFSVSLLTSIVDAENLDEKLNQLLVAGLIFRRGLGDSTRYIFKHALVQEAAHESLLGSRRKQFHLRIAQAISNTENPIATVLAHHFEIAENYHKAAEFYLAAGLQSLQISALTEATRELELGLKQIQAMEMDESRDSLELDIRVALGTARMALYGWPHDSVSDALERAFKLADESGQQLAFGPILWGLCVHYWTRAEFVPTMHWLGKLESIADEVDDSALSAVRDMSAGCQYFWQAEYARSRCYTTHIRDTYNQRKHGHIVSYANHDPLVFSLHWAGALLEWITGYPERAHEMAEQAVEMARNISHPFNSVFALTAGNEYLAECGEIKRLIAHCDEADTIIENEALGEFARIVLSNNWRGRALILQGKYNSGYTLTAHTNEVWKAGGGRICSGLFWSSESLALQGMGRRREAMQLIDQAIEYCRDTGDRWIEPELLRIKGRFLLELESPQLEMAENTFLEAINIASEHGAKSWELRASTSLANLWSLRDDGKSHARDLISPIYEWFTEGLDTQDLRKAKSLLEKLS